MPPPHPPAHVSHRLKTQASGLSAGRAARLFARAWMGGLFGLVADAFRAPAQHHRKPPG